MTRPGSAQEIVIRALAAEAEADDCHYLILGDLARARDWNRQLGLGLPLLPCGEGDSAARFRVLNPLAGALPVALPTGDAVAARAAVAWLDDGARRCLAG